MDIKCKRCGSDNVIGIEYFYGSPESYDGVSEWMCYECSYRWGRWSGLELKEDEVEGRFGRNSPVKVKDKHAQRTI